MVYDNLSIQMFENNWRDFTTKYDLIRNAWLVKLYSEKESWVPVYLNHRFWAGMELTQRSESMHAYFDSFVHVRSTLK